MIETWRSPQHQLTSPFAAAFAEEVGAGTAASASAAGAVTVSTVQDHPGFAAVVPAKRGRREHLSFLTRAEIARPPTPPRSAVSLTAPAFRRCATILLPTSLLIPLGCRILTSGVGNPANRHPKPRGAYSLLWMSGCSSPPLARLSTASRAAVNIGEIRCLAGVRRGVRTVVECGTDRYTVWVQSPLNPVVKA